MGRGLIAPQLLKPYRVVMLLAEGAGRDTPLLPRFVPIPILIPYVSVTAR